MALQAAGKIVMVGGTFVDFVLARFNADGTLDTGFGGGQIVTNMVATSGEHSAWRSSPTARSWLSGPACFR